MIEPLPPTTPARSSPSSSGPSFRLPLSPAPQMANGHRAIPCFPSTPTGPNSRGRSLVARHRRYRIVWPRTDILGEDDELPLDQERKVELHAIDLLQTAAPRGRIVSESGLPVPWVRSGEKRSDSIQQSHGGLPSFDRVGRRSPRTLLTLDDGAEHGRRRPSSQPFCKSLLALVASTHARSWANHGNAHTLSN